ncbi:MAG: phosphopantetheinyl transferase [Gammaproteobacteria bacterium]|nr:phosphopantetheinyl transferase [Gammaproteobacteria bacterium]MCE7897325.1 phosphopantetheinyl transferase [Gammaproteobacteria bacterium PRO8]MCQ3935333.1 phosphopantetheinyl transferase [Gammaproteobacteria bacterium]
MARLPVGTGPRFYLGPPRSASRRWQPGLRLGRLASMGSNDLQAPWHEAIDGLFPAAVACAVAQSLVPGDRLFPEEAAAATGFAPTRLAEFQLGRACARRALARLGMLPQAIAVGARREPCWPAGIVGSISHAGGMAVAAVAHRRSFAALGLDIEAAAALEPGLIDTVCRPEEARRLRSGSADAAAGALLVFSAKEAVYKALWPLLGRFIDFQEVAILLHADGVGFSVQAHGSNCPVPLAAALQGRIRHLAGLVATAVWIEAAAGQPASADS